MTDFNASGVMLPLDDYYKQCVVPKPKIPPRYSSNGVSKGGKRQAGHLRSYMNLDQSGDDYFEDKDFQGPICQENGANEIDTNVEQMKFEINDFDKMYWEQDSHSSEASQSCALGRVYGNNVNRPSEADPLSPNHQARGHVKSRLDLRDGSRLHNNINQMRNHQYNHHNRHKFHRRQHQAQSSKEQSLRTAYNALSSQTNHANQQTDILMNINNHFQYTHQAPSDLRGRTINICPDTYDWSASSSIGSLIESVSLMPDNRVKNGLPCETITRYTDISKDILAGETQDIHKPQTGLDSASVDSESMKVSKMAHNVMLLLKSVAQQNNQGDSCDSFKNFDWINEPVQEFQSVAFPKLNGRDVQQRFN
ncbi:uncharacterized protein LOC6528695 [Drosophila yakuba]|uniref:Uncharacterized protein, isoform A n=1 Tax=Drosophila yakuba TaxID=7245 RepID=B4P3W6_DROYA|nr:uncharacterized protein LOC6528695 [Drosophila yakuba]EDW89449.1 uncharacterized protein Dyak_GE22587, isoform A [Drosophila yakuba]